MDGILGQIVGIVPVRRAARDAEDPLPDRVFERVPDLLQRALVGQTSGEPVDEVVHPFGRLEQHGAAVGARLLRVGGGHDRLAAEFRDQNTLCGVSWAPSRRDSVVLKTLGDDSVLAHGGSCFPADNPTPPNNPSPMACGALSIAESRCSSAGVSSVTTVATQSAPSTKGRDVMRQVLVVIATLGVLSGAASSSSGQPGETTASVQANGTSGGEWSSYAGDVAGRHYSSLDQIDARNFADLEIAWEWTLADEDAPPALVGATTLMVGGALYLNTWSQEGVAIDAATGETVWVHAGASSRDERRQGDDVLSSGGPAYWAGDGRDSRVFWGTADAHLVCANAQTGRTCSDFGSERAGQVDTLMSLALPGSGERAAFTGMAAVSPPIVVNDTLVYAPPVLARGANGGGLPRYVGAWDVHTGELLWLHDGAPSVATWSDANTWNVPSLFASFGSGPVSRSTLAADAQRGIVYFAAAHATNGDPTDGFSAGVFAVDVDDGRVFWEFAAPEGFGGYDFRTHPNLVNITREGRSVEALAQLDRDGRVYVLNRLTGDAMWPLTSRAVGGDGSSLMELVPTRPQSDAWDGVPYGGGWNAGTAALDPETGVLYATGGGEDGLVGESRLMAIDLNTGSYDYWSGPINAADAESAELVGGEDCAGSGPLVTATLVIDCVEVEVDGASDESRLVAYRKNGEWVGEIVLPGVATAGPMSYMVGGVQYIAVTVEDGRVVSYTLPRRRLSIGVALTGWDADGDSVRDDIQEALAQLYDDADTRRVLEKGAMAYQQALVASRTVSNEDDGVAYASIAGFQWCLDNWPGLDSWRELATVRSLALNTITRRMAYEEFEIGRQDFRRPAVELTREECAR